MKTRSLGTNWYQGRAVPEDVPRSARNEKGGDNRAGEGTRGASKCRRLQRAESIEWTSRAESKGGKMGILQ